MGKKILMIRIIHCTIDQFNYSCKVKKAKEAFRISILNYPEKVSTCFSDAVCVASLWILINGNEQNFGIEKNELRVLPTE